MPMMRRLKSLKPGQIVIHDSKRVIVDAIVELQHDDKKPQMRRFMVVGRYPAVMQPITGYSNDKVSVLTKAEVRVLRRLRQRVA